jgi:hypothetical protein
MQARSVRVGRALALATLLPSTWLVALATPAAAAPAPSCVHVSDHTHSNGKSHVHVFNRCNSHQRVKVVMAFAPDSACQPLSPDEEYVHTYTGGRFDRLDRC